MCCVNRIWTPNVCVVLACMGIILTFSITYPMSSFDHDSCDVSVNFFLSSSIAKPPESMVGAFGISISSIPFLIVIQLRWTFVKSIVPRLRSCGRTDLNDVLFWVGVLGVIGIIGVGSFQCVQITWIHYVFAAIAFFSFNVYLIGQTWFVDRALVKKDPSYRSTIFRQVIASLSVISFLMLIFMQLVTSVEYPLLLESFFEVSMVVCFEVWILTLYNSFGGVSYYTIIPGRNAEPVEKVTSAESAEIVISRF